MRKVKERRICIICEGDEEKDYINTLIKMFKSILQIMNYVVENNRNK